MVWGLRERFVTISMFFGTFFVSSSPNRSSCICFQYRQSFTFLAIVVVFHIIDTVQLHSSRLLKRRKLTIISLHVCPQRVHSRFFLASLSYIVSMVLLQGGCTFSSSRICRYGTRAGCVILCQHVMCCNSLLHISIVYTLGRSFSMRFFAEKFDRLQGKRCYKSFDVPQLKYTMYIYRFTQPICFCQICFLCAVHTSVLSWNYGRGWTRKRGSRLFLTSLLLSSQWLKEAVRFALS